MEVLHNPPEPSSFIPLSEHQSHTPASFYSGPPILHHLSERCKIVILERELNKSAALRGLRSHATGTEATNGAPSAGDETSTPAHTCASSEEDTEIVLEDIDVWVSSERLLLYSQPRKVGVAIPYPSISLHAIQRLCIPGFTSPNTDSSSPGDENTVQGLYMQLASDSNDSQEDEDIEEDSTCLTIVPPLPPSQSQPQPQEEQEQQQDELLTGDEEMPNQTPTQELFAAISACSNLHPDPTSPHEDGDGDEEGNHGTQNEQLNDSVLFQNGLITPGNNAGGLPPAMPGSGGWITAENAHEYFDEEGNWKGEGVPSLGPGAGTVRPREEGGEEDPDGAGADTGPGGEETKWRRTD
ncbi:hypothetical protein ACO22_02545 [Paracoccidioides brasiliensis]|uniref:Uncharacterized protein n=1 Tax=Paracoccidioides brasiliensis TaxID=121759 RepID=A0A1D2JIE2_PARBR|nr:hypothetical protein ACO22_02545 [Paracoccidioides brasiliensis]